MDEPWNWYRDATERAPTEVEALSFKPFSKGEYADYRCKILDRECSYDRRTGSGDCRSCVFALAQIMKDPISWKEMKD
jgi:hypothetical protein